MARLEPLPTHNQVTTATLPIPYHNNHGLVNLTEKILLELELIPDHLSIAQTSMKGGLLPMARQEASHILNQDTTAIQTMLSKRRSRLKTLLNKSGLENMMARTSLELAEISKLSSTAQILTKE